MELKAIANHVDQDSTQISSFSRPLVLPLWPQFKCKAQRKKLLGVLSSSKTRRPPPLGTFENSTQIQGPEAVSFGGGLVFAG